MRVKRENGQFDKINFSLCIYIVNPEPYEKIAFLLKDKALQHEKSMVKNKNSMHQYYFAIDLEQDFDVKPLLIALNNEIVKDEALKDRFKIYCDITSAYDHCGIDIPSNSKVFECQSVIKCPISISVIII